MANRPPVPSSGLGEAEPPANHGARFTRYVLAAVRHDSLPCAPAPSARRRSHAGAASSASVLQFSGYFPYTPKSRCASSIA